MGGRNPPHPTLNGGGNMMNIPNIHIHPEGLQTTVRPAGEDHFVPSGRPVPADAAANSGALPGTSETTLGQSLGIAAMIDDLQKYVEEDLNIVRDPPFFPIATYQRLDLIKRVRIVEEEIQRSSLDENLKPASDPPLQNEATDTEIAAAIDRLSAFRGRLTGNGPASPEEIKPGSILTVEI